MARNNNQGALVAIIILVLLLIIAGVVAYLSINKANEYADEISGLKASLQKEEKVAEAYQIQAQVIKAYVGYEGSVSESNTNLDALSRLGPDAQAIATDANKILAEFKKDMANFGSGEENENYRKVISDISTALKNVAAKKTTAENQKERAVETHKVAIVTKDEEVQAFKEKYNEKAAQLQAAQKEHEAGVRKIEDELEVRTEEIKNLNREKEAEVAEIAKSVTSLRQVVAKLTDDNNALKRKIDDYERETFDRPDGRILGVSPEIEMVVINLGSDDGLKTNTTFAVYAKDVTNFEKGRHKATVEITRIVGPHTAEARITGEVDARKPILNGDQILNAVWDPGFRVSIALAGEFDLDSDGFSDLTRIIQEIESNGGRVTAYNDENGDIVGEVDSSTRYFVLRNALDTDSKNYGRITDATRTLQGQAEEFAVQQISVDKLYRWMGKQRKLKIERLDSRIGEDFRRRSPDDNLVDEEGSGTRDPLGSGTRAPIGSGTRVPAP